jgi:hypothetical protein
LPVGSWIRLAFWLGGEWVPNFEYAIDGTQCEHVVDSGRLSRRGDGNLCTADLCDGGGVCTHPALPCESNTTTTSTSTTSTLPGATSTTLQCTTPRCTVDATLRGPECGDEVVPPSILTPW